MSQVKSPVELVPVNSQPVKFGLVEAETLKLQATVKPVFQDVSYHVASHVPSVHTIGIEHRQRKGSSPALWLNRIKHVKGVFCCQSMSFCSRCSNCSQCCHKAACGGPVAKVL